MIRSDPARYYKVCSVIICELAQNQEIRSPYFDKYTLGISGMRNKKIDTFSSKVNQNLNGI